jgi:glyoxylase-like metal-dependent hydrolase (beta-lactamase superfamily II)/rhodanese-related sulfurtransferase
MLQFRQLFDAASSTYTYLLGDRASRECLIIDPVYEQAPRDLALLGELGLQLRWSLDTHVHADHVTGAHLLRQETGCRVAIAAASHASGADRLLQQGDRIEFGKRYLSVRASPGHTDGCLSYVLDDQSRVFTGDCLLVRGCGRTDFQQGDARTLYNSVRQQLFTLPDTCLIYPGHDYQGLTVTSVEEERRFNPRLGGEISEDDFAGHMRYLGLPHPKQMAIAVPANLRCGDPGPGGDGALPDADGAPASTAGKRAPSPPGPWARLRRTFGGLIEIDTEALTEARSRVQVLDVRERDEFAGPLGRIAGAINIPLGELAAHVSELDRSRPVVTVCRAGSRSARAVGMLRTAGFEQVANLAGGMLRWRVDGGDVIGGSD